MTETNMNKRWLLAVGLGLAVQVFAVHANASKIADTQTRVIQTDKGAKVEVFINGAGTPIVLLPSRGRGAEDFDPLVPFLQQKGYQVIRPEPRGIGKSQGPTERSEEHTSELQSRQKLVCRLLF